MRKPEQQYNVCRVADGAQVVVGVSLAQARSECARLDAEARLFVADQGRPAGLHLGAPCTHEVRGAGDMVVA